MSKTNMVKKTTLWSILVAVVLAVALVVGLVFGFNTASAENRTTLTVTMDRYVYNASLDEVKTECENQLDGLDYDVMEGSMSGNVCELVYVFDAEDVSFDELTTIKTALNQKFNERAANADDALGGFEVSATVNSEDAIDTVAKGYALRGAIAIVVFAVLAFAYVAIRYNLSMGILMGVCTLLGVLLTTAISVLTRIPVSASVLYAIAVGGLLTAVNVALNLAKLRANEKSEDSANASTEEIVASSIATKEIALLAIFSGSALVLVAVAGILTNVSIAWFAALSMIAVLVATFMGKVYAPALCLPLKKIEDKKAATRSTEYKGAKRTSTKVKKYLRKRKLLKLNPLLPWKKKKKFPKKKRKLLWKAKLRKK